MKPIQRLLLFLALAGFAIGIPVAFIREPFDPAWTFALPVGVVFLGMFYITTVLRHETEKFDEEQRLSNEQARPRNSGAIARSNLRANGETVSSSAQKVANARGP